MVDFTHSASLARLLAILLLPACLFAAKSRAADDWSLLVSPYIWFAGAKGDLSTLPGAPATSIDVSPVDALKGTEASFMLMLEGKRQRHGILLDYFYSDVLQDSHSTAAQGVKWEGSVQDTLLTAGYTYEVYRGPRAVIDIIGGLRYWQVDTKVTFKGGSGSQGDISIRNSESWTDPMVGLKTKVRLGDTPLIFAGFASVGGSGASSDYFYDFSANLGYQVTDSLYTSIGYRLFDVDYEKGTFTNSIRQEGWVMGLVWVFGANNLRSIPVSIDKYAR